MKKSLLYLFALICSVGMFSACSDDNEEVKLPIDTEIAGTYKGDLTVKVNGTQLGEPIAQKIAISQSSNGNNRITLSLKNFAFAGINVGDIEVDCLVKALNGGYSFEGQQTLNLDQPLNSCPVSVSGTVKGNDVEIQIGVEVPALGQTVQVVFIGEKFTGTEYSALKFSFEEWENVPGSFISHEYDKPQPTDLLATSAEGAAMLKMMKITGMPIYKTDDKKEGTYAIKLVTMDTSEKANALVPAITSGSVFTGKFDTKFLEQGKLYCTRFGILFDKKPSSFKGWYKYTPGTKFIDGSDYNDIKEVPNKVDECAIQAVLYEVDNEDDVLTGNDINTSNKRVAVAQLADGTKKTEYTYFDIPFKFLTGKTYDSGKKYKLAVVCSSSKEGDYFKGAGGSTLILDELEVTAE